jgi:hypothetical protein
MSGFADRRDHNHDDVLCTSKYVESYRIAFHKLFQHHNNDDDVLCTSKYVESYGIAFHKLFQHAGLCDFDVVTCI